MDWLRELWRCVRDPAAGFRARAARRPELGQAVRDLLLLRTGPALLALVAAYLSFAAAYGRIARAEGPLWDLVWARLPDQVHPADLKGILQSLPSAPAWWRVLPWFVLAAPVGVLSVWLHDSVWDHLALWLLRGLGRPRSLRTTLVADAEALQVGVFGALAGLLKYLGFLFTVLLWPVGIWFWVLRGYALAAWHGCPVWKGVVATLLHALLMGILVGGLLLTVAVMVMQELRLG
jgi:hypothetical protein